MAACAPLSDYAKFISCVKINQKKGLAINDAVELAMDMAISEDLLDGYFATHKAEVIGMILTEYNEEFVHKGWYKDGLEKGLEQGLEQEKLATVKRMSSAGFTTAQISLATDLTQDQIESAISRS